MARLRDDDAGVELVDEVVQVLVLSRALDLDAESFEDPPEGSAGKVRHRLRGCRHKLKAQ